MAAMTSPPYALFMGDFNVGKSSIINALIRREALAVSRRETHCLPTFLARGHQDDSRYTGYRDGTTDALSHEDFLAARYDANARNYAALAARLPDLPFQNLTLVDTPGMSSDMRASIRIQSLEELENALLVVLADIEYWSAKHTMDFIAHHTALFRGNLLVVANKADHLNASEIHRLCDKASARLEGFGIRPAPRFFAVSARLESARTAGHVEYRQRTKREVRERCDAGFDALRVALYEFEAARAVTTPAPPESIVSAPLPQSLVRALEVPPA